MLRPKTKVFKDQDPDFMWRGENVTRLENLSDIVFALSLGLLVTGGGGPRTYSALLSHMSNLPAVAFSMAILFLMWNFHFIYFRRYGLGDPRTIFLNALLLFLVLTIAHPLKFMSDVCIAVVYSLFGKTEALLGYQIDFENTGDLLGIYSIIYFCIFMVIFLMYQHALKQAENIGLTSKEKYLTKTAMNQCLLQAAFGVIVAVLAIFTALGPLSGMVYIFIGPMVWILDKWQTRTAKL